MNHTMKHRAVLSGDAARLLNCTPDAIRKRIQRGQLEPTWVSCNTYIFSWGDLVAWAKANGYPIEPIEILDEEVEW